jgi:hypothetical protein
MNRFFKILAVLSLFAILASTPLMVAQAAGVNAPVMEQANDPFADLFKTFGTLTGVAMFIPALVNALKKTGIVKNDQAQSWVMGLNLLAFVGLGVAQITGYSDYVPVVDEQAGLLANVIAVVVGYVYQLFASRLTHTEVLAGLPLIGTSFSGRKAGEGTIIDVSYPTE